jgi:hypothetical protein
LAAERGLDPLMPSDTRCYLHMKRVHGFPPLPEARIAGGLYLLSLVLGMAAMTLISRRMQAQGDHVNLIAGALYTGVTILLWDLFLPVNGWLSTGAAIFSPVGCRLPQSWYKTMLFSNFLFFGLYCLLIGYLTLRARFFPNVVGVFMSCAGVCRLLTSWPPLNHATSGSGALAWR